VAVLALNWLQLFTTSWDWADPQVLRGRPAWSFPVTVVAIGAAASHLALHATRRIGAATVVALVVLLAHVPAVLAYRLWLPPGPAVTAHLLLVPAALALDGWYAWRSGRAAPRWAGALLHAVVLLAVTLPYTAVAAGVRLLDPATAAMSVAVGLPVGLAVGLAASWLGEWLARVGRYGAPETSVNRRGAYDVRAVPTFGRGRAT
jgi:hypothetical protein